MGKRGAPKHVKRIAAPKAVPIHDKKAYTWIMRAIPGPHPRERSVPLGVLLRDVLGMVETAKEAKRVIAEGKVLVDGRRVRDVRFPVGLMDVVSFPTINKHYRILVDSHGRLIPREISSEEAGNKTLKVVGKHTIKGGKIALSLHDGRTLLADNNVKVGDSVVVSVPKQSLVKHLKRESGVTCLITEGKHAGKVVELKELIKKAGHRDEAVVSHEGEEFITVADYLLVLGERNVNA